MKKALKVIGVIFLVLVLLAGSIFACFKFGILHKEDVMVRIFCNEVQNMEVKEFLKTETGQDLLAEIYTDETTDTEKKVFEESLEKAAKMIRQDMDYKIVKSEYRKDGMTGTIEMVVTNRDMSGIVEDVLSDMMGDLLGMAFSGEEDSLKLATTMVNSLNKHLELLDTEPIERAVVLNLAYDADTNALIPDEESSMDLANAFLGGMLDSVLDLVNGLDSLFGGLDSAEF